MSFYTFNMCTKKPIISTVWYRKWSLCKEGVQGLLILAMKKKKHRHTYFAVWLLLNRFRVLTSVWAYNLLYSKENTETCQSFFYLVIRFWHQCMKWVCLFARLRTKNVWGQEGGRY